MFTLSVYRGDRVVQELDLEGPDVSIGRNAENQVVLADDGKGVSRLHARIRVDDGRFILQDNNSSNGTYVNGKRIKEAVLVPGQDFAIGPYRLVLGAGDKTGGDQVPVTTEVTPASTPASPASAPPREATARGTASPSSTRRGTTTAVSASAPASLPPAVLYGAGGLAVLLGAVLLWAFWPAAPQEPQIVVQNPTTTTVETTTTTVDPTLQFNEQLASADAALAAADQMLAGKQFSVAALEYERAIREYLDPILSVDAAHSGAIERRDRANARIAEARAVERGSVQTTIRSTTTTSIDAFATEYSQCESAFEKSDWQRALQVCVPLLTRAGASYRNLAHYVGKAREAQSLEGTRVLEEGRRLEAAGNLIGAWKEYDRAVALGAPNAAQTLAANREQRRKSAQSKLDNAGAAEVYKKLSEARQLYRDVVELLEQDQPLRSQAEAALRRLGPGL